MTAAFAPKTGAFPRPAGPTELLPEESEHHAAAVARVWAFLQPVLPPDDSRATITVSPRGAVAVYDHFGALLADVVLQPGLHYDHVVRPRVARILDQYACSRDVPAMRHLVGRLTAPAILDWRHPEKPRRFESLLAFFARRGLKTVAEIRDWTADPLACTELLEQPGIGPKSFDYLRRLLGHDAIPVDRHLLRVLRAAGVPRVGYAEASGILARGFALANVSPGDAERALWLLASAYPRPSRPRRARQ